MSKQQPKPLVPRDLLLLLACGWNGTDKLSEAKFQSLHNIFRRHENTICEAYNRLREELATNRHPFCARLWGYAAEEEKNFKPPEQAPPISKVYVPVPPEEKEANRIARNAKLKAWRAKQKELNTMEETNEPTEA